MQRARRGVRAGDGPGWVYNPINAIRIGGERIGAARSFEALVKRQEIIDISSSPSISGHIDAGFLPLTATLWASHAPAVGEQTARPSEFCRVAYQGVTQHNLRNRVGRDAVL